MQTVYYATKNYIRHSGNVVDFAEYRRRLNAVDGSLALTEPVRPAPEEGLPRPRTAVRPVRSARRKRRSLSAWLDATATLVLIAVAVTVWVQLIV